MQVDPIKPKLKAPGTKRLKLKCDKLLQTLLSISTCAATPGSSAADVNVLAMMADVRAAAGYCNGPVGLEGFIAAMEAVMETTR